MHAVHQQILLIMLAASSMAGFVEMAPVSACSQRPKHYLLSD